MKGWSPKRSFYLRMYISDPSDPTKCEDFWIRTLGSMALKGLNMALF